jgi:mycothiol system anti-sigma-R factor
MSAHYEIACNEVLNSFVLIIEGYIEVPQLNEIEIHLSQCPSCESELNHEQAIRTLMQETLRRTCNEQAPEELHDAIFRQIHGKTAGAFTEVVTQYSMTEISIEIDEFGQIEHREIRIEHSEEIVVVNNPLDPDSQDGQGK